MGVSGAESVWRRLRQKPQSLQGKGKAISTAEGIRVDGGKVTKETGELEGCECQGLKTN